jgi:serine protease inhibitor
VATINDFVAKNTDDKITDLLSKDDVDERTIMVLAGVALTYPDNWADLIGFSGFTLVVISQLIRRKRNMRLSTG